MILVLKKGQCPETYEMQKFYLLLLIKFIFFLFDAYWEKNKQKLPACTIHQKVNCLLNTCFIACIRVVIITLKISIRALLKYTG